MPDFGEPNMVTLDELEIAALIADNDGECAVCGDDATTVAVVPIPIGTEHVKARVPVCTGCKCVSCDGVVFSARLCAYHTWHGTGEGATGDSFDGLFRLLEGDLL